MFCVGLTRDFLKPDGSIGFGDIGLDLLPSVGIAWEFLAHLDTEILPELARDYDGLLILAPRVSSRTVQGFGRLRIGPVRRRL
jgi:hypothetical protein